MRPPVNGWAFLYARVACGVAGVPGAVWPGRGAGLLDVPVGGGPPARRPRRELRSARRLEARPGLAPSTGTAAWPWVVVCGSAVAINHQFRMQFPSSLFKY